MRPRGLAPVLLLATACGGSPDTNNSPDASGGVDGTPTIIDAPTTDAAIDGAPIDGSIDGMPDAPSGCVAKTCNVGSLACGMLDDGCGNQVQCGTCPDELACGVVVPNICSVPAAQRTCNANGWCWEHPLPFGMTLQTVWGVSPTDLWAGGANGTLLHYDGTKWSRRDAGTTETITEIWGTSAVSIYFGGTNGYFKHWNGSTFSDVEGAPQGLYVESLVGTSDTDLWVGGSFGPDFKNLWHYDGSAWTGYDTLTIFGSEAVLPFSPTSTWTMGFSDSAAKCETGTCTPFTGAPTSVYALFGTATDAWAGGWTLSHYNGAAWTETPGITEINRFAGTASDLWATSAAGLYHFDGQSWSAPIPTVDTLTGLWPHAAGGWAVGNNGTMYSQTGMAFTQRSGFGTHAALAKALVIDDGEVWFLGEQALRWRDGAVTAFALPFPVAHAWAASGTEIWAASYQGIVRFDGTRWSTVAGMPNMPEPTAVWGTGPGDVYVTTEARDTFNPSDAYVLHWNGTAWSIATTIHEIGWQNWGADLRVIGGTGPSDIWVGVDNGVAYHFDGTTWSQQPMPSTNGTFWTSPTGTLWFAGYELYKRTGNQWVTVSGAISPSSVGGTSDTDVWTLDYDQRVSHFDGVTWTHEPTGLGQNPRDLAVTKFGIFAVGEAGGIVRKGR